MPPDFSSATANIKYWTDTWEDFCTVARSLYAEFDFITPRFILTDIIDEINLNQLSNSAIRGLYKSKLDNFVKNDKVLDSHKEEIKAIADELSKTEPRRSYLLEQCKSVYHDLFLQRLYYKNSCTRLKSAILNGDPDKKLIRQLSTALIQELFAFGLDPDAIFGIPSRLCPLKYDDWTPPRGPEDTRYPYQTDAKAFTLNDVFDIDSFNAAIEAELKALTVEDRLSRLAFFGEEKAKVVRRFIYEVSGIQLPERSEITFGNVTFYNPRKKSFLVNPPIGRNRSGDEELFGHPRDLDIEDSARYSIDPVNACVTIEYKGSEFMESAKLQAINSISKAFDIFRLYYASPARFEIDDTNHLVSDLDGAYLGGGGTYSRAIRQSVWAYNLEEIDQKAINKFLESSGPLTDSRRKLLTALRWYRKAIETTVLEDKLLSYWIAIEGIFSKNWPKSSLLKPDETELDLIKEFIPYFLVREFVQYMHLESAWHLVQFEIEHNRIVLPKEIMQKLPLEGRLVSCKEFLVLLPVVLENVKDQSLLLTERIEEVIKFYSDQEYAENRLRGMIRGCMDTITVIYACRNRVVHNSHVESAFMPYIVKYTRRMSGSLLIFLTKSMMSENAHSIEEALLSLQFRINSVLAKLKVGRSAHLLDIDWRP